VYQGKIVAAAVSVAPDRRAPIDVAVIVPVFNEAPNIPRMIAALDRVLAGLAWEAVFVDDHSPDGTARVARAHGCVDRRIRVIERVGRRGLASAVVEGFLGTSAPRLAVIDGDMQHDEALLPAMFAALDDAELVIGSRYVDGGGIGTWDATRAKGSAWATRAAQAITRTPVSDPMSGFFAVRRDAFEAALPRLSGNGFKILLDLIVSSPRPPAIVELPYVFRERAAGASKLDLMVVAEFAELLADKTIGKLVPVRLLKFLIVGFAGLGIHLSVMRTALAFATPFANAQAAGVVVAMVFNFALNNLFTYRDRRLRGWRFVRGLASFGAVCSVGAIASVGIADYVHNLHRAWWAAGIAGALIGAVWNYAATSFVTWRK
jgi:dolichol-phosphate mannosyltransferase